MGATDPVIRQMREQMVERLAERGYATWLNAPGTSIIEAMREEAVDVYCVALPYSDPVLAAAFDRVEQMQAER